MNVVEQLLATLTGTCAPPRRSPGFGEDLPLSPPLTSMYLIIFFKINNTIFFLFSFILICLILLFFF
jgi:hypothetical protein